MTQCFVAAVETARELFSAGLTDVRVVHAVCLGRGGEVEGLWYWHAWAEAGDVAYDRSHGLDVELPADVFRAMGTVDPRHTHEFTLEDVARETRARAHWGPWVEDPDGPVDI